MMRTACLHLLEARIEVLAQRVSLSERLVGVGDELADALAALGELFPEEAARALARNPEEPYRRYFSLLAARVRATRAGDARRRTARRPSCSPTCGSHSGCCATGGRGVRRRDAAARHDPAGRGVRLPLRAARRARARRRGTARRSAEVLSALGVHEAYASLGPAERTRAARARDRRAAAADPVGPERVLAPRRRRSSGRSGCSARSCGAVTRARSSPTSCRAPRSRRTCSRCCC